MGLSKLQIKVMNRLFSAESEDEVLDTEGISQNLYRRWLRSEEWKREFEQRVEDCRRKAHLIIANYLPTAAVKLIGLLAGEKEQTARQACLDVLQMVLVIKGVQEDKDNKAAKKINLSDKETARIMRILAEGDDGGNGEQADEQG